MTEHYEYLSDEELDQLIVQIEQNELVMVPPDLMEQILSQMPEQPAEDRAAEDRPARDRSAVARPAEGRPAEIRSAENRPDGGLKPHIAVPGKYGIREFRQYCFRVILSVAAALVIVFTIPALQNKYGTAQGAATQRETVQGETEFQSKSGLLSMKWDRKAKISGIWKEDNEGNPAKNAGENSEKQIFGEAMAGSGIFRQSDRYSIFQ